ncbi:hypothetical protein DPMN_110525 [Dreissena polymorpha]|uniref:Uncharacterized protein n=1 Tax=Dreissena polymorpha TaxID=45954 RepID=A0A9D4KDC0_DREPO|nr:hypothetical protein DPMN_110525 [Dreissena polymorpha]
MMTQEKTARTVQHTIKNQRGSLGLHWVRVDLARVLAPVAVRGLLDLQLPVARVSMLNADAGIVDEPTVILSAASTTCKPIPHAMQLY